MAADDELEVALDSLRTTLGGKVQTDVNTRRRLPRRRLHPRTQEIAWRIPDLRHLVCIHLGGRRHFRYLRDGIEYWWPRWDLTLVLGLSRTDVSRPGGCTVRSPHRIKRIFVPMGISTSQSQGGLAIWLAYVLVLGNRLIALDNALASQAIMPLMGIPENEDTARVITVIVLVVQAILVIASTRLLGILTSSSVGIELAIVAVLVLALFVVIAFTGGGSLDNLASRGIAAADPNYFAIGGGLTAGMIMGLTTLVGFDSAANLAEEAKDPFRSVPRAIVGSVVAAATLGMLFLLALTAAIKDVAAVTNSGSPVMARDRRFPANRLMRQVNPRTQTPIFATILILAIGVALMVGLPGQALLQLIIASTILPALIYGATVVLYLAVRTSLEPKQDGFSLGRFEMPVAVAALIWVGFALFCLVTPGDATVPVVIVIGLVAVGGIYFGYLMMFNRVVLDTEPGLSPLPPAHH